jgi:hypothetical protein
MLAREGVDMACNEAGLREDRAFAALARAVAHRERVDAKLAIFDEHWAGYEAALTDLDRAIGVYMLALEEVREARRHHEASS